MLFISFFASLPLHIVIFDISPWTSSGMVKLCYTLGWGWARVMSRFELWWEMASFDSRSSIDRKNQSLVSGRHSHPRPRMKLIFRGLSLVAFPTFSHSNRAVRERNYFRYVAICYNLRLHIILMFSFASIHCSLSLSLSRALFVSFASGISSRLRPENLFA